MIFSFIRICFLKTIGFMRYLLFNRRFSLKPLQKPTYIESKNPGSEDDIPFDSGLRFFSVRLAVSRAGDFVWDDSVRYTSSHGLFLGKLVVPLGWGPLIINPNI